jgi:hypothetical protein
MTAFPGAIDGRASFLAALHWGLSTAIAQDARRIVCADPCFADWPLDDPALLQALTAWLRRPQRRLVLLARGFDDLPRLFPRFSAWRADWVHAIDGWQAPDELAADVPTVLSCDGEVCVQLIDALHWRGRATLDARIARRWCEDLDVVLQRCERALVARTLGL